LSAPRVEKKPAPRRLLWAVIGLVGGGVIAGIVALVVILSGAFDVAATAGHSAPVAFLLHFTMERSVAARAPRLRPPDLNDPALILRGATHYATGCAPCHGAPGELASPIARQMTPVPPGLYDAARDFTPNGLFWIVKHGVKMTAMPAWPAQGRDDELWAMVAFLRHLPTLKTADYTKLAGLAGGPGFLDAGIDHAASQAFDPAPCSRCHGARGEGRNGAFPRLAGLDTAYLINALRAFRDGSRPSGFMQPIAARLTDAQIAAAVKYFAGLPAPPVPATATGSSAAQKCMSCHAPADGTRRPGVPDLAGQPADYLATQLKLLASGERPSQVRAAHQVPADEIAGLAGYLSGTAAPAR
jgi:cytochrome c553